MDSHASRRANPQRFSATDSRLGVRPPSGSRKTSRHGFPSERKTPSTTSGFAAPHPVKFTTAELFPCVSESLGPLAARRVDGAPLTSLESATYGYCDY